MEQPELTPQQKILIANNLEHYPCSIISDHAKGYIISFLVGFFVGVGVFLI